MRQASTNIAYAVHKGLLHLCIDSLDTIDMPAVSLCREVQLEAPRAQVHPGSLENIQNFFICKGCEVRFNLIGYRVHYAPLLDTLEAHPNQLALF